MRKLFLALTLFSFVILFAGNPTNDLTKAKDIAKTEKKLILLKFSGSDWCVPCIKLQKQIIDSDQFQIFSEKNLVLMNADFPRLKKNKLSNEEQKINDALADKFNKDGVFPKLVLMNSEGKILAHWEGFGNWTSQTLIDEIKPFIGK
jgi:thioredoxin-related protein